MDSTQFNDPVFNLMGMKLINAHGFPFYFVDMIYQIMGITYVFLPFNGHRKRKKQGLMALLIFSSLLGL